MVGAVGAYFDSLISSLNSTSALMWQAEDHVREVFSGLQSLLVKFRKSVRIEDEFVR